jgi:hypothetical protein
LAWFCAAVGAVFFEVRGTNSGGSFRTQKAGPSRSYAGYVRTLPVPVLGPESSPKNDAANHKTCRCPRFSALLAPILGPFPGPQNGTGEQRRTAPSLLNGPVFWGRKLAPELVPPTSKKTRPPQKKTTPKVAVLLCRRRASSGTSTGPRSFKEAPPSLKTSFTGTPPPSPARLESKAPPTSQTNPSFKTAPPPTKAPSRVNPPHEHTPPVQTKPPNQPLPHSFPVKAKHLAASLPGMVCSLFDLRVRLTAGPINGSCCVRTETSCKTQAFQNASFDLKY